MASDPGRPAGWRAFPLGLTIAAAVALAVLVSLGVWQLHRLKWKEGLLGKIAALQGAPARPIGSVLARAARGEDVEFTRVSAECAPPAAPSPMVFRYALHDGQIGWRVMTMCHLAKAPFDGVLLDRGLATRFTGAMAPAAARFAEPVFVSGVLRGVGGASPLDPARPENHDGGTVLRVLDGGALHAVAGASGVSSPAPYVLAVEAERPAPVGVAPAALPRDIPNNHLVYALTWFALAGILGWFYLAMVWRRIMGR
jgi:surfeit locus 1 family protein